MWLKKFWSAVVMLTIASTVPPALADVSVDPTPDSPEGFGYKTSWFAVKTQDPKRVAQTLGLTSLQPANWASGLAAAYAFNNKPNGKRYVFISPPVTGWVLVVSLALPYPDKRVQSRSAEIDSRFMAMFGALAASFEEAQFYGSYRVVGLEAWARARGGKIERSFCYADGEVYENVGSQTPIEKQLKFPDLSAMTPEAATAVIFSLADKREMEMQRLLASGLPRKEATKKIATRQRGPIPTEGDAMAIAAHWSIDPTRIEELKLRPGVGYIAVLPSQKRQ
jgi:hypothetical protein